MLDEESLQQTIIEIYTRFRHMFFIYWPMSSFSSDIIIMPYFQSWPQQTAVSQLCAGLPVVMGMLISSEIKFKKKKRSWQILVFCSFPGNETSPESFLLHNALARKPKRIRTAFSPSQLLRLEHAFEKNHYVVGAERKQLAHSLSLTETQVRSNTSSPTLHFTPCLFISPASGNDALRRIYFLILKAATLCIVSCFGY